MMERVSESTARVCSPLSASIVFAVALSLSLLHRGSPITFYSLHLLSPSPHPVLSTLDQVCQALPRSANGVTSLAPLGHSVGVTRDHRVSALSLSLRITQADLVSPSQSVSVV